MNSTINNKLTSLQSQVDTAVNNMNSTITNKLTSLQSQVDNAVASVNTAITNCNNATDECIEVTNTLKDMIQIGSSVPSNLATDKVYLQYF